MIKKSTTMKKYLQNRKQRADYSAMESGDHFKNGASPKSQKSRGNVAKVILFTLMCCICSMAGKGQELLHELSVYKDGEKYGFKDKEGNVVIPAKYENAKASPIFAVPVKLNGKWGFIDKTGKEVIPFKYEDANYFWGEVIEEKTGDSTSFEITNLRTAVKLNGKWGFIDTTGKEVIPFKYNASTFFGRMAAVELNDKYGFIDDIGNEVIPFKYDFAFFFNEGLAAVELNGKYGFIDKTGKEVIPFKYYRAYLFTEGLAAVKLKNGKWGFIDKTGKEVIPFKYNDAKYFDGGVAKVKLKKKWGGIDKTGKEVIPFKFDNADDVR
jgi:hypothetical protein